MVLLTGATGFVGKNFCLKFTETDRIRILTRKTSDIELFKNRKEIEIIYGNIEDGKNLDRALEGVSIVVHCAARTTGRNLKELLSTNTQGTKNLISAMEKSSVRKILFLSSQSTVGPNPFCKPFDETCKPRPISFYGLSKKIAEDIIIRSSLEYLILRPCSVYGPYDTEILKIVKLLNFGVCPVLNETEKAINLIYVKDLVNLMYQIVKENLFNNRIYFVSDGNHYLYMEVIKEILSLLGKSHYIKIHIPGSIALFFGLLNDLFLPEDKRIIGRDKVREMLQKFWLCESKRVCEELKFTPAWDLKEGLRETIAWYRTNNLLSN